MNTAHEGNRDAWNRTARGGYGTDVEGDVAHLKQGGTTLMPAELRLLGDLTGTHRAIHLQCSHGMEALSLLGLGVEEVIGIDISEEMLALAERKSGALHANATWIRSDVLDVPHDLDGSADLVYTGRGAICWMSISMLGPTSSPASFDRAAASFSSKGILSTSSGRRKPTATSFAKGRLTLQTLPSKSAAFLTTPPSGPIPNGRWNSLPGPGRSAKS